MRYVELHCKSNFSFLEGASHADELFSRAVELGYEALAITDRNTLAGIVRAHTASKDSKLKLIVGVELHPIDGPPLVVWPTDRAAYGRLCRLLTRGRLRREKGACQLSWRDIAELNEGLIAGLLLRLPVVDQLPAAEMELHSDEEAFPWECPDPKAEQASAQASIQATRQPITGEAADITVLQTFRIEPSILGRDDGNAVVDLNLDAAHQPLPAIDFDVHHDHGWLDWLTYHRSVFGDRAYVLTALHRGVDDDATLDRMIRLSDQSAVPLVASGDIYYHIAERSLLHDCLLATRFNTTIDQIRTERLANSQFHLRSLDRIATQFSKCPEAIERTLEIASRISFCLDDLRYEYPTELAPAGKSPIQFLKELTWRGAKKRYPEGVPQKIIDALKHEIGLIEELRYEAYFLTVWDLVRFARHRGIICQGRGSAANSVVCYCLGVTSVDPNKMDLLFERFISKERNEAPDIDVDFEHQRREEVLQYIYQKYGRHRAGMTATVITYRIRSAIRDVGRALGISLDRIDALSKLVDARLTEGSIADRAAESGIDPQSDIGQRFLYLVQNLVGFPRHLSQHVGGMVMTQGWLCELCPLENAAMDGRTVIQWDKDDLDELGILKVDCLSLGMLSAIHRCFDLLEQHYELPLTLATVPAEDQSVYDMIGKADTIGVFQIESRAQMSMLPRLRPRCFYDLVIEVAIVRPGPIQGQMVHPYLKARRTGIQPEYPNEKIKQVLEKTMGVPIFQEQAMRLAVVAAGFTPGEADMLRRAMAAWRRPGVIDQFRKKLIEGMLSNGLTAEFADRVFSQIRGFGEYGFPESHAASFALLVYVSCWLKRYYPAAFCASIINSQPMGFYAPSQLVQDAKDHGVTVLPVDVNFSDWDCTLQSPPNHEENQRSTEPKIPFQPSLIHTRQLRLGLRMIRGMPEAAATAIMQARNSGGMFRDMADLAKRAGLGQGIMQRLADSGALASVAGDRRAAFWQALGQERSQADHSLFEAAGIDEDEAAPLTLAQMQEIEEVYADYETVGLSLRAHPVSFVRPQLDRMRVTSSQALKSSKDGSFVRVAGVVMLRQRPGTAKGITFVTLEDEFGSMNLVVKPEIWQRHYKIARTSNAWLVHGVLESREGIIHIVVGRIDDLSQHVSDLVIRSRDFH